MMPWMIALIGFIGSLGFGLLVAWGMVGLLVGGIGATILVAGALLPNVFRPIFGLAVIGFMLSFGLAGGLTLL